MDAATLERLLAGALPLALAAGAAIQDVAREDPEWRRKADGAPVSRADLLSNGIILPGLGRLAPRLPVVSEEEAGPEAAIGAPDRYWLVDPLDGTKEFLGGRPDYTVNIALVEAAAPVLGVIYVPAADELFFAVAGGGAWKIAEASAALAGLPAGVPATAAALRLPCRTRTAGEAPVAVASRSHPSPETDAFLARHGITRVVNRGSSLKMCAVAEGAADVYPRLAPTCYWDTAAGTAIAREAGCRVLEPLTLDPLAYDLACGLKHAGFVVAGASFALRLEAAGR